MEALAEEVSHAIAATELAVQYLGTLATLHGALTGSRELVLAPTELTALVRSAASVVRPQLQPGVELRVEVPPEATHVMADGLMLTQVLLNLMQNAARFTRTGFVCVRCRVADARNADGSLAAQFAVLDSGSGISEATKATLFDLYNSVGGIGIGMFLSGKLLSLLGSKIEVESPWRGDGAPGAAFYFDLVMGAVSSASSPSPPPPRPHQSSSEASPARTAAAVARVAPQEIELLPSPSSPSSSSSPPANVAPTTTQPEEQQPEAVATVEAAEGATSRFEPNLRVLVADDQLTNRRLLRVAFSKHFGAGWQVTEVTTAEEALALATSTTSSSVVDGDENHDDGFALIVMDEMFAPGPEAMLGSAAIRQIRAHEAQTAATRRAVIVSCTGNALSSLAADLRASGADLVWGKPMPNFTNDEMQKELAPLLAGGGAYGRHRAAR